jgi:small subunit ribosomal protein S2
MSSIPALVFIVDTKNEINAVREARKLKIPIIGMIDTNADPGEVDFPIPSNDDAMRAINLFCRLVADACLAGKAKFLEGKEVTQPEQGGESKENAA